MASQQAAVHPLYKEKIVEAKENDTIYATLFDIGWPNVPHRVLVNSTVKLWQGAGEPKGPGQPGEGE